MAKLLTIQFTNELNIRWETLKKYVNVLSELIKQTTEQQKFNLRRGDVICFKDYADEQYKNRLDNILEHEIFSEIATFGDPYIGYGIWDGKGIQFVDSGMNHGIIPAEFSMIREFTPRYWVDYFKRYNFKLNLDIYRDSILLNLKQHNDYWITYFLVEEPISLLVNIGRELNPYNIRAISNLILEYISHEIYYIVCIGEQLLDEPERFVRGTIFSSTTLFNIWDCNIVFPDYIKTNVIFCDINWSPNQSHLDPVICTTL